jgi:hypothetical protein
MREEGELRQWLYTTRRALGSCRNKKKGSRWRCRSSSSKGKNGSGAAPVRTAAILGGQKVKGRGGLLYWRTRGQNGVTLARSWPHSGALRQAHAHGHAVAGQGGSGGVSG